MLNKLIELWGVNEVGLIALEYQVPRGQYVDEFLAEVYSAKFNREHPTLYIESLEIHEGVALEDYHTYLCCTMGDGHPVAIEADVPLTAEQYEEFTQLSEDFYAAVTSILEDAHASDPSSIQ